MTILRRTAVAVFSTAGAVCIAAGIALMLAARDLDDEDE